MTEALMQILRVYLDCGYSDQESFWRMTLPEIFELLSSAERRLKREQKMREIEMKERIVTMRNLALQTAEGVACLFDKNKKTIRGLDEYYPTLFKDEMRQEMSLENYTDLFLDFAYRHNQTRKRMKGG